MDSVELSLREAHGMSCLFKFEAVNNLKS